MYAIACANGSCRHTINDLADIFVSGNRAAEIRVALPRGAVWNRHAHQASILEDRTRGCARTCARVEALAAKDDPHAYAFRCVESGLPLAEISSLSERIRHAGFHVIKTGVFRKLHRALLRIE